MNCLIEPDLPAMEWNYYNTDLSFSNPDLVQSQQGDDGGSGQRWSLPWQREPDLQQLQQRWVDCTHPTAASVKTD
ncbi:hypothetical protein U1Q18_015573 [Sarracenia purpurea var. burkii]